MSKPALSFGLNLKKKPVKPAPAKKKAVFGGHDSDDDDTSASKNDTVQAIGGELEDLGSLSTPSEETKKPAKSKASVPSQPPKLKSKAQPNAMFGDLSSSLVSKRNAAAASELDSSVYEYDAVYDSLKPKKNETQEDKERKPKYMQGLLQAAEVRKRDQLIAEEKKIAREREAEGDEFAGTEKFVTEAYKKQQAENRRMEEEEKLREEQEAKKNKTGGMSAFYRDMLKRDEEKHAQVMQAAEDAAKNGAQAGDDEDKAAETEEDARLRELNDKGANIATNEEGQVVDKRQLLRGGLNVGARKKAEIEREAAKPAEERQSHHQRNAVSGLQVGKKQAMRERQSRMLAEQLEQSLKRTRDEEAAQRAEVERNAKSQKTEGEISSAKERYLARKRAAEEAKKAS